MSNKRGHQGGARTRAGKRGQLTLFVILGILIVVITLFLLFFFKPSILGIERTSTGATSFQGCAKEGIDESISLLAPTAGFSGDYFNITYNGIDVPYICYSDEYYKPCVVQVPFLEEEFKRSLSSALNSKITDCYNDYVNEFKRQGYEVTTGEIELELDLQKDKIKLDIEAPLSVASGSSISTSQGLSFEIPTKIYDILMLANNIVKFETTVGEYELVQSQLLYPDLPVNAMKLGDETVVYIINDKETKYQFAVRSYARPPGYGF